MFIHPRRHALCAALLLAPAACVAPPPIVLNPVPTHRAAPARPRQARPCEPAPGARLTEAEKTRLFNEFDAWKEAQRPPGAPAGLPAPPPAPEPARPAPPGCRVTGR